MPSQWHGNTRLEVAWTILPSLVLLVIALPSIRTIFASDAPPPTGLRSSLHVRVIGHQWWWEFQYPELGVTTADELHVPVRQPVYVDVETADVIHSFWFPSMGGKRDAIPAHVNHMAFTADSLGEFPGQCAELCGLSHANMRMKLMVETPETFKAWVAAQKA